MKATNPSPSPQPDALLRPKEAAERLAISVSQLRTLVRAGRLARVMVGQVDWRIAQDDIQRFIQANRGYEPTILRRK